MTAKENFDKMYNDLGCFEYIEDGFICSYKDFYKVVKWNEIQELIAYKADLFVVDNIEMLIVLDDVYFTIDEEMPGWYQFVLKTKEIFPAIPKEWDVNILFPAFAENRIVLFSKSTLSTEAKSS